MNIVPVFASAWQRFKAGIFLWRASHRRLESEPVLCSELFSAERMESHGKELAERHRLP